jgi:hypothetical protein
VGYVASNNQTEERTTILTLKDGNDWKSGAEDITALKVSPYKILYPTGRGTDAC